MTHDQKEIIQFAHQRGGYFTKQEAVKEFGAKYYCNGDKYVGDRLSRMVDAGLLERTKPGYFRVGKMKSKQPLTNAAQTELFQ